MRETHFQHGTRGLAANHVERPSPQKGTLEMNIQLTNDAMQFVEGLVTSGEFESADEAVTEGVRLLMSRQRLRADIQKGIDELDAGLGIDGEEVFAELRARAKAAVESAS